MKTTLVLDDRVVERLKREAARSNQTMSELVEAAIRRWLDDRPAVKDLPKLPLFHSGGYLVDISDREALYTAMEKDTQLFVVDTNVLVYAADADAPEHDPCRASLEEWRRGRTPWYVTWGIVYEFLRVVTHPRVLRTPFATVGAMSFVEAVLASPSVHVMTETPRHLEVLAEIVDEVALLSGNLYHDAHTATLMRENGLSSIVTRDTDFHRFPFLEVVDPLRQLDLKGSMSYQIVEFRSDPSH